MSPREGSELSGTHGSGDELNQQLWFEFVASSIDAIICINSDKRVLLFNPAAEAMFQVAAEEAIGQPLHHFIPEPFGETDTGNVTKPGGTDAPRRHMGDLGTVKGLRADGSEFPAEVSISQFEAGGRRFYAAIVRDGSERRPIEALAVETAQLGTYERDLCTNEVRLNDVCREILGLSEGVPPPDIARKSAHPQDKDRVLAVVTRAFDPKLREVCAAEFRILRTDGSVRWVAGRGRVVFDDTVSPARPLKFLGVLLDITERKLAEAELLRAKHELTLTNQELERHVQERTAQLQEMVDELEHMAYSMIHDMRAPLRAIQGFAGILQQHAQIRFDEEALQLMAKIQTSTYWMDKLLTDVLNYNRVVRSSLPVGPINLHQLLNDLLAAHSEFRSPHAVVSLEGEFPTVIGNEAGLAQCFAELVRNAVKFVEPGKLPRVRVWAQRIPSPELTGNDEPGSGAFKPAADSEVAFKNWVRICVEDNGTGIPEAGLSRIFDMFQRMHGREYPGTGIGLALVRKITERMGGRVGVESEEGKGSSFWLELPEPHASR